MTRTLFAGLFAAFLCLSAHAEPPPGTDLSSPLHVWFDHQYSVGGAWCCRESDGHVLADEDWRTSGDHYEVRINSKWYPIPARALRDPVGGPNPTGHAIVWYLDNADGPRIFCFTPGFQT